MSEIKRRLKVRLVIVNGKAQGKKVALGAETLIGRSPDCKLKIASSQVSRRHCRLIVNETQVLVEDLASANGTLLQGQLLPPNKEIPVDPGQELEVGPLKFVFEFERPSPEDEIAAALSTAVHPTGVQEETVDYPPALLRRAGLVAVVPAPAPVVDAPVPTAAVPPVIASVATGPAVQDADLAAVVASLVSAEPAAPATVEPARPMHDPVVATAGPATEPVAEVTGPALVAAVVAPQRVIAIETVSTSTAPPADASPVSVPTQQIASASSPPPVPVADLPPVQPPIIVAASAPSPAPPVPPAPFVAAAIVPPAPAVVAEAEAESESPFFSFLGSEGASSPAESAPENASFALSIDEASAPASEAESEHEPAVAKTKDSKKKKKKKLGWGLFDLFGKKKKKKKKSSSKKTADLVDDRPSSDAPDEAPASAFNPLGNTEPEDQAVAPAESVPFVLPSPLTVAANPVVEPVAAPAPVTIQPSQSVAPAITPPAPVPAPADEGDADDPLQAFLKNM